MDTAEIDHLETKEETGDDAEGVDEGDLKPITDEVKVEPEQPKSQKEQISNQIEDDDNGEIPRSLIEKEGFKYEKDGHHLKN